MKKYLVFVLIALLMGAPLTRRSAHADNIDLVKLQKEEEARKKKLKKTGVPAVVVTNETLKKYETKTDKEKEGGQEGADGTVKTEATVQAKPPKIDPIQTQEYWQNLKKEFEQKMTELKTKIEKDRSEYNRLFTQHLITDLPLEKANLKKQLDNLAATLKDDEETLKRVEEEFELLPEKARKAGVPAGWLR